MSKLNKVVDTRKTFSSPLSEDSVLEKLIGTPVRGTLEESNTWFYGVLESYNDHRLLIRGNRGQEILIKRKRISRLEAV